MERFAIHIRRDTERRRVADARDIELVSAGFFNGRKIGGVKLFLRVRIQHRPGGFAGKNRGIVGQTNDRKIRARHGDAGLFFRAGQVADGIQANDGGFAGSRCRGCEENCLKQ